MRWGEGSGKSIRFWTRKNPEPRELLFYSKAKGIWAFEKGRGRIGCIMWEAE